MHVAVVMPAHNEAAGLPGFVREVAEALKSRCSRLSVVVVDDLSTDDTADAMGAVRLPDSASLSVVRNRINLGHGPTALRAYIEGLGSGADAIVHVDGDGQFLGSDIARVLDALDRHDVVHGVRRGRTDAWFRRVLTFGVGVAMWSIAGGRIPDVNTPLRVYRREVLTDLLAEVPADAMVPHLHFSVLETRAGMRVAFVPVTSIPRRGGDPAGTMWGTAKRRPVLPPARLRRFVRGAVREIWIYRLLARTPARVALSKAT